MPDARTSFRELAFLFLRLGATAFGGPAAHIGLIQTEVVERRRWLPAPEFLDLLGAATLLPGPTSTELAMYVGHRMRGWRGLVVAGASFIAPAALLVLALAWTYQRAGTIPAFQSVLGGITPVVIAIIAQAVVALTRTALKNRWSAAAGAVALALAMAGVNPYAILVGGAILGVAVHGARSSARHASIGAFIPAAPVLATAAGPVGLFAMAVVFVKIGLAVFGSGYVLLAFLRVEFVERLGWLTERQLLDAVAAGQLTPGPVFTTATFIGYLIAGMKGALVATLSVFAPAFILVGISGAVIPRLRRASLTASVLDLVNVASLALMVAATVQLARGAIVDVATAATSAAALLVLLRYRVNSPWLIGAGAAIGWLRVR